MYLRFQGSYTAQAGVSTRSYYLSTLDVNQCQDQPQILLPHLSNHLHTVPPIHPLHSRQITTWYSEEAQKQKNPRDGGGNGEVNVDLRLTALKPLYASWLVNLYNHLSSRRHISVLVGATSLSHHHHITFIYPRIFRVAYAANISEHLTII